MFNKPALSQSALLPLKHRTINDRSEPIVDVSIEHAQNEKHKAFRAGLFRHALSPTAFFGGRKRTGFCDCKELPGLWRVYRSDLRFIRSSILNDIGI